MCMQGRQVPAEPQAADRALKEDVRRLLECMRTEESTGAEHAVCVVSNDMGFDGLLRECKGAGCRTVAISNQAHAQYRHADVILAWELVQRGMSP